MTKQGLSTRINELHRLNEMAKTLKAEQDKVKKIIIEGMKELCLDEYTTGDSNTAKLKTYTETRLDTGKLKEFEPKTYAKFSYTNEITRLTVN